MLGGATQLAQQGLSLLATLVLVRLLSQAEFGFVAAANSVLGFSAVILSFGFSGTVVRRRDLTEELLSTVMWLTILAAGLVSVVYALTAPYLATLFGLPVAAPYIAALAPMVTLTFAASIPLALLRRQLRFGAYYTVGILAMTVYVVLQISLALAGFGAWSVVIGQVAMSCVNLVGGLVAAKWLPRLICRPTLLRDELSFTGGAMGVGATSYAVKNADYWVVGSLLGAGALGAYYIAFVIPSLLRVRLSAVVSTVLHPVFARAQDDPVATRRIYVESSRIQAGVGVPAMVGIAVLAGPIVSVFFGDAWSNLDRPLQWIALAVIFEVISATSSQVSYAHKRTGPVLVCQLVRLAIFVPALLVAAMRWQSIEAVAVAMLVSTVVWCVVQQVVVASPLGLSPKLIARDLGAVTGAALVMAVAVGLFDAAIATQSALVRLAAGTALGVTVYFGVGVLVFGSTFRPLVAQTRRLLSAGTTRRRRQ